MNTQKTAEEVLSSLGGKNNIVQHSLCMTRLRMSVANPTLVDKEALLGVDGVLGVAQRTPQSLEIVFGPMAVREVFQTLDRLTQEQKSTSPNVTSHSNSSINSLYSSVDARKLSSVNARELSSALDFEKGCTQEELERLLLDNEDQEEAANISALAQGAFCDYEAKRVLVINGPNLNLLGLREVSLYGTQTYQVLCDTCIAEAKRLGFDSCECYQSNHEGDLVDKIQEAYGQVDGIILNPAAYTHTSVALLDALKAVQIPTVEVHLTKVEEREDFRKISYVREACLTTITGKGIAGYTQALEYLANYLKESHEK